MLRSLLVRLLTRPRVAQAIKWVVYLSLIAFFGVYVYDDWVAFRSTFASAAPWPDIFQLFSTTIDTAAWLGLVFLFELETYALPDEAFKAWVARTIHAVRLVCYIGIAYAAYGYTADALGNYDVGEIDGLADLCQVADQGTALQLDVVAYTAITSENCSALSSDAPFYRISNDLSVIDGPTLAHIQWLGWLDVLNAIVWVMVVLLIETEVRMQAADRFGGRLSRPPGQLKTVLYGILLVDGVIWAAAGYPIYACDAVLWIVGFWVIEFNLIEWRQELAQAKAM